MNSSNFNLMFITNNPELAEYVSYLGINRIFVDLEFNGKFERQGHLDTLISRHQMKDVLVVRKAIGNRSELLVRLNPLYEGSELEIEQAIASGADLLMLPMFRTAKEVEYFSSIIKGRVKFIPLVETIDAYNVISDVVTIQGVSEIYIGLNDLHREMNLKFMFEPLANGSLDKLVGVVNAANLPFGFGGIARIGQGILPAELILSEHVRLKSSCAILSRTFHGKSTNLTDITNSMDMKEEVKKIFGAIDNLKKRNPDAVTQDKNVLNRKILEIVAGA